MNNTLPLLATKDVKTARQWVSAKRARAVKRTMRRKVRAADRRAAKTMAAEMTPAYTRRLTGWDIA